MTRLSAALLLVFMSSAAGARADVQGRVLTGDGNPVAGATVRALAPEPAEARAKRLLAGQERRALLTVKSGADGSFSLAGPEPMVEVGVRADGHAPAIATALQGDPLTVILEPAITHRGTVTAGGKPVPDATIVSLDSAGVSEVIAHTAKDGSYEITVGAAEWVGLTILHRDFAPLLVWRAAPPKALLHHELLAGRRLQGRLIEEITGRGVGGATVSVDGWPQAESAADGSFTVAHALPEGRVVAAHTNTLLGMSRIGSGTLMITMKRTHRLVGVVRDARTRQPLAGAVVSVNTGLGETSPTATTDARGQYEISSLAPARYWANVSRLGYVPGFVGGDEGQRLDLRKAPVLRRDFDLAPQRRVAGRVQDEKGRPIEGAIVLLGLHGLGTFYGSLNMLGGLLRMDWSEEEPGTVPARTARDGSFVLTLPEGSTMGGLKPQLVALKRGYAAGTTLLPPETSPGPVVITLPTGVTLKGHVRSEEGAPLEGVVIALGETGPLMSLGAGAPGAGQDDSGWVKTGADGSFAVQVHPVPHQLAFRKPGFVPQLVEAFDPRRGEDLRVVLQHGAEIRGRILRQDGRGMAEATVTLQDAQESSLETAASEEDGAFLLRDLAPGAYELVVTTESGASARRSVEAPATDVRIELSPTTTVRGRVVDAATHAPVSRFRVALQNKPEEPRHDPVPGRSQEFVSDDGRFAMDDVPLGESTLDVQAEGYRPKQVADLVLSAETRPPEIEVVLDPGLTIQGRITSAEGGALEDASVSAVAGTERAATATTDENGEYELVAVPTGELTVEVTKQGFRSAHRTVQVQQSARVDLALSRGLFLRGVVVAGDVGVAEAQVHASSSATDADTQSAVTDEAGRFTLQGLAPGRYDVTASATGHKNAEAHDVNVETAGSLRLVLSDAPTAALIGTVVGVGQEEGARPPVVMVQVQSEEESFGKFGIVDMAGAFRIEDAPAGRVTVTGQATYADGRMRSSVSRELTLAAGSETTTVVEFRDDLAVTGTVIRAGLGLPAATVSFHDGNGSAAAKTDHEGHYEVSLAPGSYSVDVSGESGLSYQTRYQALESATFDIDVTGAALHGRVVEAGSDVPVADADISLWLQGGSDTSPASALRSGTQGSFEAASLPEGRYRVLAAKKGFGQQSREVELMRGTSSEVLFELEPAEGVSVAVVDARDGRTLEAIVVVRDLARSIVANGHSGADKDGAVTIPLRDGPYLLSVSANKYGTVTRPVTAPARGLRIGLTPGGTLVIESPRNLHGRIRLVQPDGEDYVSCWCNGIAEILLEGRRTTVEHITPGRYNVVLVDAPEGPPHPVDITEGSVSTLTIE